MMIDASGSPMNFYKMYDEIKKVLPDNCIIVNEGANTMDIGRTMLQNQKPRLRLDAGSFGTMGVGAGFAVAAALVEQTQAVCEGRQPKKVICIQGDSAFGFGAMELETAARYRLPIIFVVANNNGIYNGMDLSSWNEMLNEATQDTLPLVIPPVLLDPANRYERIMHAFNCEGYDVVTTEDLIHSFEKSLKETKKPSLIHIHIEASSQRKTQEFGWLTASKL